MIYSFDKNFASKIAAGEKTSTIRNPRKDGKLPKIGEKLYFYTGPYRAGERKMIGKGACVSCNKIILKEWQCSTPKGLILDEWAVFIDDISLPLSEVEDLVRKEGFEDINAFWRYFMYSPKTPTWRGIEIFCNWNTGKMIIVYTGDLIKWELQND